MTSQKKKQEKKLKQKKHKTTTNNVVFLSFFSLCFVVARQWQIDMFPLKRVWGQQQSIMSNVQKLQQRIKIEIEINKSNLKVL